MTESDKNDIASEPDSQSSSPPEDSLLPEPPLPETPAPQPEDIPEPSPTAIPDRADTVSIEIPDTPPPQPEKFSVSPPSERKRLRWKTAVLLTLLLAGITAFCWMAGEMKSKSPSFTVRDAYYGDYDGENAYYVIAEFASEPTNDDLFNFNERILSLSVPVHAETDQLPFIQSGYTEDGIYYEVHGEPPAQYRSISQEVTRQVTYEGKVNPPQQLYWEEQIYGITYTGTLQLVGLIYRNNQTIASYKGIITSKN